MYNKKEINRLFEEYVETGDDKVFSQLMRVCEPIIDIVLMKYKRHSRHFRDVKQEVQLKLWQRKRDPVRMRRYLINPSSYLFFVINRYTALVFEQYRKLFKEDIEVSFSQFGEHLLSLIQSEYLDPEVLYLVKHEIPGDLFERCKKKVLKNKALSVDFVAVEEAVKQIKELVETDFSMEVEDESEK